MNPHVTAAVKAAAEAQLYAYARMAVALARVAREYEPSSEQARSLSHAVRALAVRARAGPNSGGDLTGELAAQAECLVGTIPDVAPPDDWAVVVQRTIGKTLNELWGVRIVLPR